MNKLKTGLVTGAAVLTMTLFSACGVSQSTYQNLEGRYGEQSQELGKAQGQYQLKDKDLGEAQGKLNTLQGLYEQRGKDLGNARTENGILTEDKRKLLQENSYLKNGYPYPYNGGYPYVSPSYGPPYNAPFGYAWIWTPSMPGRPAGWYLVPR